MLLQLSLQASNVTTFAFCSTSEEESNRKIKQLFWDDSASGADSKYLHLSLVCKLLPGRHNVQKLDKRCSSGCNRTSSLES